MRRFKFSPLPNSSDPFTLDGPEAHHLLRVLRAKVGDSVQIFDGQGWSIDCRITACDADTIDLTPIGAPVHEPQSPTPSSALIIAQVKPKALDVAIRMATEVGISTLIIFPAAHSISREPKLERWSRLSVAAAKQCGRNTLPRVLWAPSLQEAWALIPEEIDLRLVAHPNSESNDATTSSPKAIFVGPEGGFRTEEVTWLCDQGAQLLSLGQWILRADTAATVAAAMLCNT